MKEGFNLINYDIYSKRIGFFFNNNEKIGSYFGLFLTVSYILISFILFFFLLIRTIQRKEIKVYDSTIFSQETPIINVDSNLIYFAFGLEDPITANRFVDETIYFAKIIFFDRTKINGEFQTQYRKEMDYEICKEENFGENYKNLFLKGELSNSYCLKDFNLTLAGGYKYNRMSYFRIRIYPCKNSSENNYHCKSPEIIDNYFKGGYISILTKDIGLNPTNYSFPVLATLQDLYTTVDKQIYRDYILYYGITEIQTDIGLFLENIVTKRFLDFRKESESFNFRGEEEFYSGKAICSIAFRLDDIIKVQKRTYTKLKEVFSSTGGYMQLISTCFTLLSFISNKLIPELKIINGIFNFNLKKQKMMLKINSIKELNSIHFPKKYNNYLHFPNKKIISQKKKSLLNLNNISKNSLLAIDINDNNSSIANAFNNKEDSFNLKRGSAKQNNVTEEHLKISMFNDQKLKISKDKTNNNEDKNIFVNGLYLKSFNSSDKNKIKNKIEDFNEKINFNLYHYICFGKNSKKEKEIELFNSGYFLYKKRMDIISVFTFLFLVENFILENEELNPFYKEIE